MSMTVRVLKEARPFWPKLLGLLGLHLLALPIAILLPYPLRYAVDHVLPAAGELTSIIWLVCGMEFGLLVLNQGVSYAAWLYQTKLGEQLSVATRLKLFAHVQKLSLRYHDSRGVGELVYQLQSDVASMQSLAIQGLIPMVTTVLIFVSMAYVSFKIDAMLTLVALGVLPITLVLSALHLPRSRVRWADVKNSDQGTVDVMQQALGAGRVVRAFGQERRECERLLAKSALKTRDLSKATLAESLYGLLTTVAVALASAAALYLGILHVREGRISLGDFLVVMAYLAQLLRPLDRLTQSVSSAQSSLASASRVFKLLGEEIEVRENLNAEAFSRARGEIEFSEVGFGYRVDQLIVDGFSLRVPPGARVGFTGPSGSGKTTLFNLLLRFFDPTRGEIRLDGVNLRDWRLEDLRRQFAVILQEPVLFMGTIADNIAYGRPEASREEIIAAAKSAEIHEFILALPEGYETLVGDRGMNLSGGERQRISIARAFLLDAPVLLMDEPTSQLDAQTQGVLAATLLKLQKGRTVLTISHRPELVAHYDLVIRNLGAREELHEGVELATT